MKHEKPAVIFKDENIRSVCLRAVHSLARGCGDIFEARYPCRCSLDFDRHIRNVDAHERGIAENLFPTSPDVLPTGQPIPVGMDTNGARVGGPDFVHQIQIEAFQGEVKLEVSLYDLLWIGHKV